MTIRNAYDTAARAALRASLATAPASALAHIAGRGARIDALRHGAPTTVSGNVLDRACDAAVHFAHGADGAHATAASATKALRADDAPAVRYALDHTVTGALYTLHMRVKRASTSKPPTGAPAPAVDVAAARIAAARGVACRDLTLAFQARARSTGTARKAATSQIRAIVRHWSDDPAILSICAEYGWTVTAE